MTTTSGTIKAHCPRCGPNRNAFIRAEHTVSWRGNEGEQSEDTGMVLECCGCEKVFFRRDYWFSEWDHIEEDPLTGDARMVPGVETTYWPSPITRAEPQWLGEVMIEDRVLGHLLNELYSALNGGTPVLAAIGIRTAFDRASELLAVSTDLTFGQKLDRLQTLGRISAHEHEILGVLTDAGGAAAHRAWEPMPEELSTMMDVLEAFLHRSFVLGEAVRRLRAAVPARQKRLKNSGAKPVSD